MRRKKIIEAAVVCILLLLLGAYMEFSDRSMDDKNRIIRGSPGSGRQEVELTLNAGEKLKNYDYQVSVPAQCIDEKTAQSYFSRAEKEIDETFFPEGEEAAHVTEQVHMKPSYVKRLVKADWTLDQYNAVDVDGTIREDQLDPQGELVQASVALTCEKYREEYTFSFQVYPKVMSQQEKVIHEIAAEVEQQSTQEGERYLTLPDQAAGVKLQWKEKKQHLVWKILFFEVLVCFLMAGIVLERKRTADHIKKEQMKLDYAEVVSKLLILLGAGMSLKQAWNRISAQYSDKRQKKQIKERYIYEEMIITNHEILDGESERLAYQKFGERVDLGEYQRLIRILLQNLQTGSRGLCKLLEQESENALEERKALACKLGEEAGTKMLLPLMMMLGIVIAIIMIPAMLSFQV